MPQPPQASANNVLAGIGFMILFCFIMAGSGALAKAMMMLYPFALIVVIRNLAAIALLSPTFRPSQFREAPRPRLQLLRTVLCGAEGFLGFAALNYLPLVDMMTYYLATPIYVTAFSAVLLREPVGWRRWSAVVIGFIGVLIALRPSAAMFSWPALIALVGSILYGGVLLTTRVLRGTSENVLMLEQLGGVLIIASLGAWFAWVMPSPRDLLLIVGLGVVVLFGSFCVVRSMKYAPASVVAPYQYTLIIWSALFGYAFFNETPHLTTLIGAVFIIAAGLYIFMREKALSVPTVPPGDPV